MSKADRTDRIALLGELMDRYNAQDTEAYAAFFTPDGCEAAYRGPVLRDGQFGIRDGYAKVFAEHPHNRAEVIDIREYSDQVVVREKVMRSPEAEPFEVMAIYSFDNDKISRVEFVR